MRKKNYMECWLSQDARKIRAFRGAHLFASEIGTAENRFRKSFIYNYFTSELLGLKTVLKETR